MNRKLSRYSLATLIGLGVGSSAFVSTANAQQAASEKNQQETAAKDVIVVTAAKQNLQAPGVSTITAEEIQRRPLPAISTN